MSTERELKILGISCIRSDYDLLSEVFKTLHARDDVQFRILVGGAHLSPTFGMTVDEIRRDNLPILARIESLVDSDSPAARAKTAAILMQSMVDALASYDPDVILYAGDREDALVSAFTSAYLKIPSVHFFGGDHAVDGNVDNPVRHAISKLSTFHLVSHEQHRERLVRIGEDPGRIHVIGSPALDKYRLEPAMGKTEVFKALGTEELSPESRYAVLIYHPILNELDQAAAEARTIIESLVQSGIHTFVSSPNTDAGSRQILGVYEEFGESENLTFFKNTERNLFVNMLRHADFLIGNSSLGLAEAPSIPLPAINVGNRQRGRLSTGNVIFVDPDPEAIRLAMAKSISHAFRAELGKIVNPFGDGRSSDRAVELITTLDHTQWLFKREDPLTLENDQ